MSWLSSNCPTVGKVRKVSGKVGKGAGNPRKRLGRSWETRGKVAGKPAPISSSAPKGKRHNPYMYMDMYEYMYMNMYKTL